MLACGLFLVIFNSSFVLGLGGDWHAQGNVSSLTIEKISFYTQGKCNLISLNPSEDVFNRTTVLGYTVKITCPVMFRMDKINNLNDGIIEFYTNDEIFNCNQVSNEKISGGAITGAVIIKLPTMFSSSSNKEYKGLFTGAVVTHNLDFYLCPNLLWNDGEFYGNKSILITGTLFAFAENGNKIEGTFDLRSEFQNHWAGGDYNGLNFEGFKIDYLEDNHEQRLSILESWRQTVNSLIQNIVDVFMPTTNAVLEEQNNTMKNFAERISALENKPSGNNETFPSYLMTLSLSTRKDIVCAYAQENHLYAIQGLGWNCGLTYKTSNSGKVSVKCSCKKG